MLQAVRATLNDGVCVRRCVKVAAVVGTILTLINHGDVLIAGEISALLALKVAMNYAVPFIVCSTGYAAAMGGRRESEQPR